MKTRIWASVALVWSVLYLGVYVAIATRDDNGIAWWYVAMVGLAAALIVPVALQGPGLSALRLLLVALILLVVATLLGIATIGLLLVPAIVAAAVSLSGQRSPASA